MVFPLLIFRSMYFDLQQPVQPSILSFRTNVRNLSEDPRKISPVGRNDTSD
jgi:hypothetical protein